MLFFLGSSYGSLDEYLDSIGFTHDYREMLRQNVMEKDQS